MVFCEKKFEISLLYAVSLDLSPYMNRFIHIDFSVEKNIEVGLRRHFQILFRLWAKSLTLRDVLLLAKIDKNTDCALTYEACFDFQHQLQYKWFGNVWKFPCVSGQIQNT